MGIAAQGPEVFGKAFSVYVQSVRIALEEKGVAHDLVEVDAFEKPMPQWYAEMHPFGKMPAFRHGDVVLYESRAILGYVDEAFAGPPLMPVATLARARVRQALAVLDHQAYAHWVRGLYVGRSGRSAPDVLAGHRKASAVTASALAKLIGGNRFLAGTSEPTLADCLGAPMAHCLAALPDRAGLLTRGSALGDWWDAIRQRPAFARYLS